MDSRAALITGGSSGIGLAIARVLGQEGYSITLSARRPDKLEAAAESLRGEAIDVIPFAANMASEEDIQKLGQAHRERYGRLDVLVNNAGIGHLPQPLEGLPEDEFDRILAVNVKSIYLAARAAVPRFKTQKRGVILNIASTAGVSPRPRLAWYNASKGWVITATRAMAVELAPFGIRVNALNPVAGETPLLKTFLGEDTPEMRAKFLATIPIGRFSTPEDLGNAACFLCSDEASMITGVAMEVDGGRCI
jgi:3-oxoacyl-[acyl-carrier protein] reductase